MNTYELMHKVDSTYQTPYLNDLVMCDGFSHEAALDLYLTTATVEPVQYPIAYVKHKPNYIMLIVSVLLSLILYPLTVLYAGLA